MQNCDTENCTALYSVGALSMLNESVAVSRARFADRRLR
jgi:hypothetical protein